MHIRKRHKDRATQETDKISKHTYDVNQDTNNDNNNMRVPDVEETKSETDENNGSTTGGDGGNTKLKLKKVIVRPIQTKLSCAFINIHRMTIMTR